ncbi:MAG: MarR family transcriptional regulator [Parachlamydia sp.]|nr:MarR family transcriptional regulator [Parachlamydia sp.]
MKKEIEWNKVSDFKGPEQSPGFLLWQVSTEWRRQMESTLMALGLTHPQFVLLASVAWLTRAGGQVTQVELARHCKTDITMTSQILRTLEKKGYIERVQRKGDVRSKFPVATKLGRQLIEKALPAVEATDREFFKHLGRDVATCVAILQRLVE